jgi:hypothetical protein
MEMAKGSPVTSRRSCPQWHAASLVATAAKPSQACPHPAQAIRSAIVSRVASVNPCLICERVALAKEGSNPHLIAEMDHSYFVVGDHQFHQGYGLVLLKAHVREPFELSPDVQREHFREVMRAAEATRSSPTS